MKSKSQLFDSRLSELYNNFQLIILQIEENESVLKEMESKNLKINYENESNQKDKNEIIQTKSKKSESDSLDKTRRSILIKHKESGSKKDSKFCQINQKSSEKQLKTEHKFKNLKLHKEIEILSAKKDAVKLMGLKIIETNKKNDYLRKENANLIKSSFDVMSLSPQVESYKSENVVLLKILEQMSSYMKSNQDTFPRSKSNIEIKRFYADRSDLMKTFIFDRTLADIYRPTHTMLEMQQRYLECLRTKLEDNQNKDN